MSLNTVMIKLRYKKINMGNSIYEIVKVTKIKQGKGYKMKDRGKSNHETNNNNKNDIDPYLFPPLLNSLHISLHLHFS